MTAAVPLILPVPAPLSIVVEFVALRFGEGCVVNLVGASAPPFRGLTFTLMVANFSWVKT